MRAESHFVKAWSLARRAGAPSAQAQPLYTKAPTASMNFITAMGLDT